MSQAQVDSAAAAPAAGVPQIHPNHSSASAGPSGSGDDAVFEAMERLAQAYPKLHKARAPEHLR